MRRIFTFFFICIFFFLVFTLLAKPIRADVCSSPYVCMGSTRVDEQYCDEEMNSGVLEGCKIRFRSRTTSCNSNCENMYCSSNDNISCEMVDENGDGTPDYCQADSCNTAGNCCGIPIGPTNTPGGGPGPGPVGSIYPIFRVLLDTDNNPATGEQQIYTSSGPVCSTSNLSQANPFSVSINRPPSDCSSDWRDLGTYAYHNTCLSGPGINYWYANGPGFTDPSWGDRRYYWIFDSPEFTSQFDVVGYGGTGQCDFWFGAMRCWHNGGTGQNGCASDRYCPTDDVIVRRKNTYLPPSCQISTSGINDATGEVTVAWNGTSNGTVASDIRAFLVKRDGSGLVDSNGNPFTPTGTSIVSTPGKTYYRLNTSCSSTGETSCSQTQNFSYQRLADRSSAYQIGSSYSLCRHYAIA